MPFIVHVVSRHLAYQDKTQWSEYWEFLGEFCDLAKPNGLEKLEQYLSVQCSHLTTEHSEDPLLENLSSKYLLLRVKIYSLTLQVN